VCGESRMRRSGWGSPEKDRVAGTSPGGPTSALWHNLAEYAGKTVAGHRGCLKDPPGGADGNDAPGPADTPGHEPPGQAEGGQVPPDGFLDACGRERRLVARTRERYAEIRGRLDAGESLSAISRDTGLDRKTVQRFARAGGIEELLARATSRESRLACVQAVPAPAVERRRHRRRRAPRRTAGTRLGRQRADRPPLRPAIPAGARRPGPGPAVPKTRQITRWLLTRPDHLQQMNRPSSRPSAPAARTSTHSPGT